MRTNPGLPAAVPNVRGQAPDKMIRQVRRYELITPLFGGGVLPQQADPITTVRGSEIRGQLRFWWRACRGGRFNGDLHVMKAAEDELWGAGGGKDGPKESQVQIALSDIVAGKIDKPFEVIPNSRNGNPQVRSRTGSVVPAYAAFPLQPEQRNARVGMDLPGVQVGVKFTLTITYPHDERIAMDIAAALWAWETFGGIGGRTRRGFGALCCTQIDGANVKLPTAGSLPGVLKRQLEQYVSAQPSPPNLPHLTPQATFRLSARKHNSSLEAWRFLIGQLRDFRQNREPGVERNRPGRSYWPEPDEIRRRFPDLTPAHRPRHSVRKFPRAAFGLPIVFHFKDRGDPQDTTLQGVSEGRLASPLILRPILCSDGAVGIGLLLEGNRNVQRDLKLHDAPVSGSIMINLTPADAASIPALRGQPDVLLAFLNTL